MLMESIGIIIGFIWNLLCTPFDFGGGIVFNTWQFYAFIFLLVIFANKLFGVKGSEE